MPIISRLTTRAAHFARAAVVVALALCALVGWPASARAEIELGTAELNGQIILGAETANHWRQGAYDVWLLRGNCFVDQGLTHARSDQAVVWIERAAPQDGGPPLNKVIVYLEGKVEIDLGDSGQDARYVDTSWFGRFVSIQDVRVDVRNPGPEPEVKPAVYRAALARRDPYYRDTVERTNFAQVEGEIPPTDILPAGARRLRAYPRSAGVGVSARWMPSPDGQEWIAVIDSGVNLIIDGVDELGSVDILTDRIVIWTRGLEQPDLAGETAQSADTPLEIYMEGNIVFRQGDRVVYAERMYYDVTNRIGTLLGAEVLTPVPDYQGLLRLKANVVQQTGRDTFYAQDAFITSSRMGRPGYRLQSKQIFFEDRQVPVVDPYTGGPTIDPQTGAPVVEHERLAKARNNLVFLGPVPVFYWPTFATDATDPTLFVDSVAVKQDRIFGTQVMVDFDAYEVLGIAQPPRGTDWDISTDYLSERGFAGGTSFRYNRNDTLFFGVPSTYAGVFDAWGLHDDGTDNLGLGRQDLVPETRDRGRAFVRHRQFLPGNFRLTGEVGWISDRNFLESFFENEWDSSKDYTTGIELKRLQENSSWSITADARINDFFTQTQWLPRGDHFLIGQSLLGDRITWYEHSSAAYANLKVADAPTNPADTPFQLLPWEVDAKGERFVTTHEIDYPFALGAFKLDPYVLGQLAHWGEDINADSLDRAYGQAGLRASIPFWSVNPTVENLLWNVHGVAHKVVFEVDAFVADANENLTDLPEYDPLQDDNIEAFQHRYVTNTFGGVLPPQFDERFYALRRNLPGAVTSPSAEVADDMAVVRLGMNNRWQTKRGFPGRRRTLDWIVLDTGASYYPNADRDNFGEDIGLVDYDFRWHIGDKTTLLSAGLIDFFDMGQKFFSIGGHIARPPRGGVSLEFRHFEGPFITNALIATYSYRLSPKWVSTLGSFIDIQNDNYGQTVSITRVGESLLVTAGLTNNSSKDVVGVNFSIEPRFLPRTRTPGAGGATLLPAGLFGLE